MKHIVGFENKERYVSYPFAEDTSMQGTGIDTYDFPTDVIKDLQFYSISQNRGNLKLSTMLPVSGISRELQFTYAYDLTSYTISVILVQGTADDTVIEVQSAGVYKFKLRMGPGVDRLFTGSQTGNAYTFSEMFVEPSLIRSEKNHYVNGISGSNLNFLTGDVVFKEGYNVAITSLPAQNVLRFGAAKGAGEGEPCEYFYTKTCCDDNCGEKEAVPGNCNTYIFYINGLHPDWFGNFVIEGGRGISVSSPGGNIVDVKANTAQEAPECEEEN